MLKFGALLLGATAAIFFIPTSSDFADVSVLNNENSTNIEIRNVSAGAAQHEIQSISGIFSNNTKTLEARSAYDNATLNSAASAATTNQTTDRFESMFPITHGISAGWITDSCAVIWSKTNRSSVMNVALRPKELENSLDAKIIRVNVSVDAKRDFTGRIRVCNLLAGTSYSYTVWFTAAKIDGGTASNTSELKKRLLLPATDTEFSGDGIPVNQSSSFGGNCCVRTGSFRTAPSATSAAPVRFVFGADLAGHNTCRDINEGFPMLGVLLDKYFSQPKSANDSGIPRKNTTTNGLDLFVGLGDMIYADKHCLSIGRYGNQQIPLRPPQSVSLEDFWAHWRYLYSDSGWQQLLAQTGFYTTWDDHEVCSDFGPYDDAPKWGRYRDGNHLLPVGLEAMLDYNAIPQLEATPNRLYTNVRWGQHVELIILDIRQYRDPRSRPDSAQWPKTLLGIEQKTWLKHVLRQSDATWKIIACSVPLALGTGGAADALDSWANDNRDVFEYHGTPTDTGYEQELRELFEFMARDLTPISRRQNIVFVTADVHFAAALRHQPLPNITSDFVVHEIITGPMNAVVWTRPNGSVHYDQTFNPEELFMLASDRCNEPGANVSVNNNCDIKLTWNEAKQFFNVAVIEVDESGSELKASLMNALGKTFYELVLRKQ